MPRLAWRPALVLILLALAIAASLALWAGSRPRLPQPFGPAANGWVAYAADGDIGVVDPETGGRRWIATGHASEREPRFSPDGTRIAFLREQNTGNEAVVVVDLASGNEITASEPIAGTVDEDGFEWLPDGSSLVVRIERDGITLLVVDARLGTVRSLGSRTDTFDAYARPPDGRQLLLVDGDGGTLLTLADGTTAGPFRSRPWQDEGRVAGWTPDGSAIVIQHPSEPQTAIVDVATGVTTTLPVAWGHVSNDGTRVAGLTQAGLPCVMALTDTSCRPIGKPEHAFDGEHLTSVLWSPDDRWLLVQTWPDPRPFVLDPAGIEIEQPTWIELGWDSWQRVAP